MKWMWQNDMNMQLRLLTESLILIGSAMFGTTFNLHGYLCRTNVIFGTLTDGYMVGLKSILLPPLSVIKFTKGAIFCIII